MNMYTLIHYDLRAFLLQARGYSESANVDGTALKVQVSEALPLEIFSASTSRKVEAVETLNWPRYGIHGSNGIAEQLQYDRSVNVS